MPSYDHKRIEKKWQKVWRETGLYKTKEGIKDSKFYVLDMFPYPSGDGLHVGHPKGYIATDVYSRMKRMQGYSILHPMGWDAFGLPAENYAIQNKIHPAKAVEKNIKRFKKQLELLGFNYDWEREINTTDPNYYKWTQWLFLQMFHHGLAYRSNEPINWCPSCKTGLANEDLEDGRCERCGSVVEKKAIPQWVLKITDYADQLLTDLDTLNWPEYIKESQRNWIGRSEGLLFTAPVKDTNLTIQTFSAHFEAFYADTFVVIAPDHPRLPELVRDTPQEQQVIAFARMLIQKRTQVGREAIGEPEGIFTGRYIVDPVGNGDLPIWVANFAIADYGTGIVKASAHDERDFAFAKKYNIRLKPVIFPDNSSERKRVENLEICFSDMRNGVLAEPVEFAGRRGGDFRTAIADYAVKNGFAERKVSYKLRDWVFSRQRYWGEPIPLVFCEACKRQAEISHSPHYLVSPKSRKHSRYKFSRGELLNPGWIGVDEDRLPVKLPNVKSYEPTGTGESPLAAIPSFVHTKCPKCGGSAKREINTMPQWAGSCWYHLAYIMREDLRFKIKDLSKNKKSRKKFERWLPVDMYVGGAEHATRHLIYARFWHKFLYDIGVVNTDEPFTRLQNVGLILASDGRKMSKRFGNVISPDDIVRRFGADSLRVYEMFMGPFNQAIAWSTDSLVGARRFLERVWRLRDKLQITSTKFQTKSNDGNSNIKTLIHQTIKKVGEDIEQMKFNTAVSALMILVNAFEKEAAIAQSDFETLLKLLAPFAPHITEELSAALGHRTSVHAVSWPAFDAELARGERVTIVAQVNGRTRGNFEAERGLSDDEARKRAETLPAVHKWINGKEVRQVIVVKDRLVNIVIRDPNDPN